MPLLLPYVGKETDSLSAYVSWPGGTPGVSAGALSAWFLLSFPSQCNAGNQNLYFGRGTSYLLGMDSHSK